MCHETSVDTNGALDLFTLVVKENVHGDSNEIGYLKIIVVMPKILFMLCII